jgi:hypothetical protein
MWCRLHVVQKPSTGETCPGREAAGRVGAGGSTTKRANASAGVDAGTGFANDADDEGKAGAAAGDGTEEVGFKFRAGAETGDDSGADVGGAGAEGVEAFLMAATRYIFGYCRLALNVHAS